MAGNALPKITRMTLTSLKLGNGFLSLRRTVFQDCCRRSPKVSLKSLQPKGSRYSRWLGFKSSLSSYHAGNISIWLALLLGQKGRIKADEALVPGFISSSTDLELFLLLKDTCCRLFIVPSLFPLFFFKQPRWCLITATKTVGLMSRLEIKREI